MKNYIDEKNRLMFDDVRRYAWGSKPCLVYRLYLLGPGGWYFIGKGKAPMGTPDAELYKHVPRDPDIPTEVP